jgi:uncharacterized membrane protein
MTEPILPSETPRRGMFGRTRDYLLTGLLAIGPSVLTLVVVFRLVNWLDNLLGRYLRFSFYDYKRIPGLGIIATLFVLLFTGWMVTLLGSWIGGRSMLRMWEHLLTRIPGVGILYGSAKSIGQALLTPKKEAFQHVVLVQWPLPDTWRIGFIAGPPSPEVQSRFPDPVEVVFVPHTPNPASGFVHYVPAKTLIRLDWTVEDGLKVVISGGVVQPGVPRVSIVPSMPGPAAH